MARKRAGKQPNERRACGLAMLREGKSTSEAAKKLKVTSRSVRRWRQEAQHPKRKRKGGSPGRPRKLSARQEKQLEKVLKCGAYAQGYAEDYWTLDRIGQVIWQQFEVRYDPSAVWHVLDRMGWSCQRPQRRPLQRNEQAIEQWKEQELPRIKKTA